MGIHLTWPDFILLLINITILFLARYFIFVLIGLLLVIFGIRGFLKKVQGSYLLILGGAVFIIINILILFAIRELPL